jgi:hypothetical protein
MLVQHSRVLDEHDNSNKENPRNREPGCIYTIEYANSESSSLFFYPFIGIGTHKSQNSNFSTTDQFFLKTSLKQITNRLSSSPYSHTYISYLLHLHLPSLWKVMMLSAH